MPPPDPIPANATIPTDTWTPPPPPDDGSALEPPPTQQEFDREVLETGLV